VVHQSYAYKPLLSATIQALASSHRKVVYLERMVAQQRESVDEMASVTVAYLMVAVIVNQTVT